MCNGDRSEPVLQMGVKAIVHFNKYSNFYIIYCFTVRNWTV